MAQYYWLFPDKDCLLWLQPEMFSCRSSHKLTLYSVSASPCRLRGWASGVGSESQVCGCVVNLSGIKVREIQIIQDKILSY